MRSIVSRVQRLEEASLPSGLLLQPWSVSAEGAAMAGVGDAWYTQAPEETLGEFQRRAGEALHPRRPVLWISEVETAL